MTILRAAAAALLLLAAACTASPVEAPPADRPIQHATPRYEGTTTTPGDTTTVTSGRGGLGLGSGN